MKCLLSACLLFFAGAACLSHETETRHDHEAAVGTNQLRFARETRGPVRAPPRFTNTVPVSGQGFWRFIAATNVMPVPVAALPFVRDAHGTLIVDAERDIVYWGLKNVGWIGFSNELRNSWIVSGDGVFSRSNIHGADLLPRRGQLPLVVSADNEEHEVYLSDTTFQGAQVLSAPDFGPYATNNSFRPTDAAFVDARRLFITDGYARGYFMPASTEPFAYEGTLFGGRKFSQTPHGITYSAADKALLVSARPEGQVKRWSIAKEKLLSIDGLPKGTLLCDVDLWGDHALAACLIGPNKTAGPLMILNLKKKTIASIIKPKEELGYDFAQHIHDAVWYLPKHGRRTEVYLLFTAWNPGGVGALKLVNAPERD